MIKKNRGITLISLIVTIVLLLILAGITISSLTGSGLFEKSQQAKQEQENAQIKENTVLADYENEITQYLLGSNREQVMVDKEEYENLKAQVNNTHNYSTEEKVIGTWIDGKKLYQKVITGKWSEMPDSGYNYLRYFEHGIENIDYVQVTTISYKFPSKGEWRSQTADVKWGDTRIRYRDES